jgi:polyhydroxyalkanoate synthesis regulator phasin
VNSYWASLFFAVEPDAIDAEIRCGNFEAAKKLIDQHIFDGKMTPAEIWNRQCQKEIMERIKKDFRGNEKQILNRIKQYYPEMTSEQIQKWKADKSLEIMIIDGKEQYFRAAAANFFRINKQARQRKLEKDGQGDTSLNDFLREHLSAIYSEARQSGRAENHQPQTIRVTYTLTVLPDAVPEGEIIRCWLPYPYRNHRRQTGIVLLDSNLNNPIISPPENEHSSVYAEKIAEKNKPTIFRIMFQYCSTGEWFDLKPFSIKPYQKESELYKKYTGECSEHIIFTEEIKNLSKKIIGTEKEPVAVCRKIYETITSEYPWASSREYSTMRNIPSYVIENGHGDCGMLSLLFITLCRYNGIPAKWQSGFMMHPNHAGMHDWAEVYFEGIGWIPVDTSFGERKIFDEKEEIVSFFMKGIDSYRLIVNEDYSCRLYPAKIYPRSETVDFQRGEVEWRGGNLYFDQWNWNLQVEYIKTPNNIVQ